MQPITSDNIDQILTVIDSLFYYDKAIDWEILDDQVNTYVELHASRVATERLELRAKIIQKLAVLYTTQKFLEAVSNNDLQKAQRILQTVQKVPHPYVPGYTICTYQIDPDYNFGVNGHAALLAAELSTPDMLILLRECGVSFTQTDDKGHNILHYTARKGHLATIKYLLEVLTPLQKTFFLSNETEDRQTPQSIAEQYDLTEAAQLLLSPYPEPLKRSHEELAEGINRSFEQFMQAPVLTDPLAVSFRQAIRAIGEETGLTQRERIRKDP
jgi:hypothetical protein